MANIKNFGLSGVSADVQFGKAGGRVVYDAGASVFKVTQADGSTLDNIRVATTPVNGNDAASKTYVDSASSDLSSDIANVAADLATETSNRISGDATTLASAQSYADQAEADAITAAGLYTDGEIATLDAALSSDIGNVASDLATEVARATAAEGVLTTDLATETTNRTNADTALSSDIANVAADLATESTARANADTALDGRLDIIEGDATTEGSIAKALADAKAYTDQEVAGENELAEMNDVTLTSAANGDLLMYNGTMWVNVDVDTDDIDEGSNLYWTSARGDANFATNLAASDTGDLAEGTNLYWTTARGESMFDTRLATKSTTDLAEGSNLYYTDARARAAISVTDNGGDGALSYDSATGVISYTGPSAAEVRAHFTGGTGISITNGDIALDFTEFSTTNVVEGSNLYFTGARAIAAVEGEATLDLTGALTVAGSTTLEQLVTIKSAVDLANADANVNVFHVTSSTGEELFEVRQNGDAVVAGTLTVNGSGATVNGSLTTGNTTTGDLTAANATFTGNVAINGNLTVDGDATFVGTISGNDMSLAGNLIIGDADTDFVTFNADVNSDILPDANLTYDLGSSTKKWAEIHVGTVYATTLNGTLTGQVSDISNHEAYIEGLFSVVDNGGDGELTYANGVFTYTGPSAAEVRAHFSAGTGVDITNGVVSIGQAVGTTDNVTFNDVTVSGSLYSNDITAADVVVNGNLTVTGTTTTVNTETIELADNIIVFNSNATGTATQDAGIEIERGDDTNVSLLWDETNNRWTVGGETFVAATFIGNLTGDVTGTVSSIANHDTDALAEGSLNLYYTDARVAAYLVANSYATETYVDNAVADKDSFAIRAAVTNSGSIGTIVNVAGKTYYVSRIVVDVTTAFDAAVSVSDGTNTLMSAASIEEDVVGTYVAEMDFSTATSGGATISLVSAATAGAATVTVEYVQL
jgi:hypothetical protein